MEWTLEVTVTVPIRWQQLRSLGQGSSEVVCALNQHPMHGMSSSIGGIQGSRNEGLEKGLVLLTSTPSGPLGKYLFPVSWMLNPVSLDLGSREESTSSRSHNKHPIELEAQTFPWPLWASEALPSTG